MEVLGCWKYKKEDVIRLKIERTFENRLYKKVRSVKDIFSIVSQV